MEEYHVLMLNSLIAATLCMAIISIILTHDETRGGSVPLIFAVWMFSIAWLSVLLYIIDFKSLSFGEYFISCNKIFLFAGYLLFLWGVINLTKVIFTIMRQKEVEKVLPPKSKLQKNE